MRMTNPLEDADSALISERLAYSGVAKMPDTADQFGRFYQLFGPWLGRMGATLAEPKKWPDPAGKVRVGFVLDNATGIAHGANLFKLLQCLNDYPQDIEPVIFSKEPADDDFKSQLSNADYYCFRSDSEVKCWLLLRTLAQRNYITALVWVSVVPGIIFSKFINAAPVCIWWSQKWHTLHCPGLGLIDTTHPFKPVQMIAQQQWRCAKQSMPRLFNPDFIDPAQQMRNELEYRTVFGWFGREEKLFDKYFNDSIAQILKAVPDSCFLWTSRQPHEFGHHLDEAGLSDRHKCIGWVDTALWTQVADIGLDSFPFGMGHTGFQMWEAGKPVVGVATENPGNLNTMYQLLEEGPPDLIEEANELITIKPYTETIVDFIDLAIKLANDKTMQHQMGEEGRLFLDTYMRDDKAFAETFAYAVTEIIEEQRNAET